MSVTAEQYLRTSFEHDAEFVEGKIVERPAPCWEHSCVQGFLCVELRDDRARGWRTMLELKIQTGPDRYRVPDICIITARPDDRGIVTLPPYLCVEILSPEDTAVELLAKVREYLNFGVEWVWVIDPVSLSGQVHSGSCVANVENRTFSTDRFTVDLSGVEF